MFSIEKKMYFRDQIAYSRQIRQIMQENHIQISTKRMKAIHVPDTKFVEQNNERI